MAGNIRGITIEIGGETKGLTKALSEVRKETNSIQRELKDVEKALKLDPKNTELLAQKQQLLSKELDTSRTKLEALKQAKAQADADMANGTEINQEQYRKLQREIVTTEDHVKSLEKQTNGFNATFKNIGNDFTNVGNKMTDIGKKGAVVSGAIGGIGAAAVSSFYELDEGYDTIIEKTGATGDSFDDLKKSADNVFTSMPTDMADVGVAIGEVNTRFKVTGDELESLSKDFIKFAEINDTDLNTSIANTSKIMQAWNVDISETPNLLGLISSKAQETGISTDKLMTSVLENNATFKEMGLSLTQSVTLMAQFEQNGVNSSQALMGLRKSIKSYTDQGLSMDEALRKTIESIKNAETSTEALSIATEIFGTRGAAEMATAIREGRINIDDLSASMTQYGGVVSNTFNATLDPADDMKQSFNNLKLAGSELGNAIQQTLMPIIQALADKISSFTQWFTSLDAWQQKIIVIIGVIVAAIPPLIIILGTLFTAIGSITTAVSALNVSMLANPAVLITAAIIALIAALVLLYNKCEWFREAVNVVWEQIKIAWDAFIGAIKAIWENAALQAIWENTWNAIKTVFNMVIDSIKTTFQFWAAVFKGDWEGAWNILKDYFGRVWENIKNIFLSVIDSIKLIFNGIIDFIQNIFMRDWTEKFGEIGEVINGFSKIVTDIFGGVKEVFNGIIDFVKNVFTGNWEGAWTAVKNIFKGIFDTLVSIAKAPINGIIGILNAAIGGINALIGGLNKIKINAPDWVPGIGGKEFGINIPQIPKIPLLAKGGIVNNGGMAIVGEAGAELLRVINGKAVVQPLNKSSQTRKSPGTVVNNYNYGVTAETAFEVSEKTRKTLNRLAMSGVFGI